MDMPKKNLAASNRSCNTPVGLCVHGKPSATLRLQQSRCKIYYGTCQTEYQIHVWEGRVDNSLHQNYRKPSHVCAIMPCTEDTFKARKFPSGCWHCMYRHKNYSIATKPNDYNDYLISKLCVQYLKKIPDAPIVIK